MPDPIFDQSAVAARLRDALETMVWASTLVPARWTHQMPESAPGDSWTVAMNLAHIVTYEKCIGLPLLESLAAGGDGTGVVTFEQSFFDDAQAIATEPIAALLEQFRTLREREIAIVQAYDAARFNSAATDAFNTPMHGNRRHTPAFIATKSFQHTWEHGNAILRALLFVPD